MLALVIMVRGRERGGGSHDGKLLSKDTDKDVVGLLGEGGATLDDREEGVEDDLLIELVLEGEAVRGDREVSLERVDGEVAPFLKVTGREEHVGEEVESRGTHVGRSDDAEEVEEA